MIKLLKKYGIIPEHKLFKKLRTQDDHKAVIRIEETPWLMTEYVYHLTIFSKEKRSEAIYRQEIYGGDLLAAAIAQSWTIDKIKAA